MDDHTPQSSAADALAVRSASALRKLQERAQSLLAARREQATQLESNVTAQLDAIAAALAENEAASCADANHAEKAQADAEQIAAKLEDAHAVMKLERAAWESEREALEKERAAAGLERKTFQEQRGAWETERSTYQSDQTAWEVERSAFTAERELWSVEREAWLAERNKLTATAAKLEADLRASEVDEQARNNEQQESLDQSRKEIAALEQKLASELATHEALQAEWSNERTKLQDEFDQSQQKFELAREDVQRLRSRVTELEQDLARRPETNKADSAELIALRAERDALAARVDQLEHAPVPHADADAEQEIADLRRRFELAVEDIRELKSKNTQLETQVAEAKRSVGSADSGGMDWESQKRRLLASLEGGSDEEPVPQKERATIESTIEMTDAVVAEKDLLIADLKAQLDAAGNHSSATAEEEREAEISTLIDTDAVIAGHRQKIAQIEQDMEAKLRAAELELSVERAKIARQRAELEELRIDLESKRSSLGDHHAPANPGAPKRRWLSKLGLNGDEKDGA